MGAAKKGDSSKDVTIITVHGVNINYNFSGGTTTPAYHSPFVACQTSQQVLMTSHCTLPLLLVVTTTTTSDTGRHARVDVLPPPPRFEILAAVAAFPPNTTSTTVILFAWLPQDS